MGLLRKKSEKNCSGGSKCSSTKKERDCSSKTKNCAGGSKCSSSKTTKNSANSKTTNTASRKTKACGK